MDSGVNTACLINPSFDEVNGGYDVSKASRNALRMHLHDLAQ